MKVIRQYADRFLDRCADRYGEERTPLFADGLDLATGEPLCWLDAERRRIPGNFARQQIVMPTLAGPSALTGDARYESAARSATRFMFDRMAAGRVPMSALLRAAAAFL